MIYIDVTSSCKSPMNTGVQRVVRELHRTLAGAAEITSLIWDPQLRTYCRLSKRERGFLTTPFARSAGKPDAEPGRRANPVPVLSKWRRALTHRRNRLSFPQILTKEDTVFVPEIFQDNRVTFLPLWADQSAARFVTVCHDAIAWRRPEVTLTIRQAGFNAYLEAMSRFHAVVAVSVETRDDLLGFWRAHGLPPVPVTVEPWAVDHAGGERPISPPDPASRSVLCVGTFEPRKNHLTLLEAARQVWKRGGKFELVLVGRTTAGFGDTVLAAVRTLQAEGWTVRWLRHVDDDTLNLVYQQCAFTVFPSLVEGFGLPILESLWHGRPCLCGGNGAIGEIARGGGCLTVDQSDAAGLADGIERLLNDGSLRGKLTDQARVRSFETWEALVRRLLPLLRPVG